MNDGTITLENVYPLNVNNLNLNQVGKLVLDKISLDDASAEVFVRLNNARLVTVQISGNVKSPRTIAVPAYTPMSRIIAYSGGISDSGSLRNISLSQIGETTQTVDFYNFLQNPSSELDPLIKNGARIFVPFKGPTIAVTGFVNNPGIYELPNDKSEISIKNLLSITGTSFLPSGAKLKVSYFDSNGQATTRLVAKDDMIKEGEAFRLLFESDMSAEPQVRQRLDRMTYDCAVAVSAVISLDTGFPKEESMVLAIGLIGCAQITARHWLERDGKINRSEATSLVTNLLWRGISGFPLQS